jgi:hypothetical protein
MALFNNKADKEANGVLTENWGKPITFAADSVFVIAKHNYS